MWQLLGSGTVDQNTESLALGLVDGALTRGHLPLRFRFSGASDWRPLSFAIVLPVAEGDGLGLPTGRVYPRPEEAIVTLGPGVGDRFTGRLYFRPRNYNLRWIRFGLPVSSFSLTAWVWLEEGTTDPVTEFRLFVDQAGGRYVVGSERVGPKGAAPLIPHG